MRAWCDRVMNTVLVGKIMLDHSIAKIRVSDSDKGLAKREAADEA